MGSDDHTARVWDVETMKPFGPPLQHPDGWVFSVAFSPDGSRILTGGGDSTACLWKMPPPMTADPKQIKQWIQVTTGTDLDAAGRFRTLDADEWQRHHQNRIVNEIEQNLGRSSLRVGE